MLSLTSRLIWIAALFVLIILSGLWLSHSPKPLNVLLVTVHKLLSLGTVVFIGFTIYNQVKPTGLTGPQWIAVILSILLVVLLFASGAFLSGGKPVAQIIHLIHKVAPALIVLSVSASVYLIAYVR